MNDFCDFCGLEIDKLIDSELQRFCSNECRVKYHNQTRKALRKYETINRAIDDLYSILDDNDSEGMHPTIANMLLNLREGVINSEKRGALIYKCRDCDLPSFTGQLICSCGGTRHYQRYVPVKI